MISEQGIATTKELIEFIKCAPTAFHAVAQIRARLESNGFVYRSERERWEVKPGDLVYTIRNDSSIVAMRVGKNAHRRMGRVPRFLVAASHSDSPTYKLKASPEIKSPGDYLRLDVEPYGGLIDRSWLDRPLSVGGRMIFEHEGALQSQLVYVDRDILLIPSLAIHLNRDVNKNGAIDRHRDIYPMASSGELEKGAFLRYLCEQAGMDYEQLRGFDLALVNRQEPTLWGACNEFVSSPRLDDLQCAYATLEGFCSAQNDNDICVYACFDNEEVGSGTMQGALSTLLPDVLRRVASDLGWDEEDFGGAVASSILMSCDNAQAVSPNHSDLYDEENRVYLNKGVVLKEAANQRYTTDAVSRAFFDTICRRCGVPTQRFANRSDLLGGSTLGNLALRQVSMHAVDVGLPQLAMHSAYETSGVADTAYMIRATRELMSTDLELPL